jgi:hypothetical protein
MGKSRFAAALIHLSKNRPGKPKWLDQHYTKIFPNIRQIRRKPSPAGMPLLSP